MFHSQWAHNLNGVGIENVYNTSELGAVIDSLLAIFIFCLSTRDNILCIWIHNSYRKCAANLKYTAKLRTVIWPYLRYLSRFALLQYNELYNELFVSFVHSFIHSKLKILDTLTLRREFKAFENNVLSLI